MKTFHEIMTGVTRPVRTYFVRHGESEGNVAGIMQGHLNSPLSSVGRVQARRAGAWFAERSLQCHAVLASPLDRATETASIIASEAGWPSPEPLPSLMELNTGSFEGLSFSEIKERHPEDYAEFLAASWESVPNAEPSRSLIERALLSWEALVTTANGLPGSPEPVTLMAVSHGGMLQWIFKTSQGASAAEGTVPWMPLVKSSNCGISAFDVRPVRTTARTGEAMEWYYGQWSMINRTPWDPEREILPSDDQFASR